MSKPHSQWWSPHILAGVLELTKSCSHFSKILLTIAKVNKKPVVREIIVKIGGYSVQRTVVAKVNDTVANG